MDQTWSLHPAAIATAAQERPPLAFGIPLVGLEVLQVNLVVFEVV